LRTVLCTSGGLNGALVLRRLRACERLEISAVVRSSRVLEPRFGFVQGALEQIRRSGLRYALYLWCSTTLAEWLWALHAIGVGGGAAGSARAGDGAAPVRTRAGRGTAPVRICAVHGAAPAPSGQVFTTRDINDARGLEFLAGCAPDLLVSAFFNQRLRPPALSLAKLACVNIHPSLLPEAKGVDPVFQTLLQGAPLGVTVHFMTAELDAGRILVQRPVSAPAGASVFEATAACFRDGADLLVAAIERIALGARGQPQNGAGSYQSWPTPAEVAALRARGGALARVMDFWRLVGGRVSRGP
jgi:methionyl-tRNA formyltransferase